MIDKMIEAAARADAAHAGRTFDGLAGADKTRFLERAKLMLEAAFALPLIKPLDWERGESISRCNEITGDFTVLALNDGEWKFTYGTPGKTATIDMSKHTEREDAEKAAQDLHNYMIHKMLTIKSEPKP